MMKMGVLRTGQAVVIRRVAPFQRRSRFVSARQLSIGIADWMDVCNFSAVAEIHTKMATP